MMDLQYNGREIIALAATVRNCNSFSLLFENFSSIFFFILLIKLSTLIDTFADHVHRTEC